MIQINKEMPEGCCKCDFASVLPHGFRCNVSKKKYETPWNDRYTYKPGDCPLKLVEITRNITDRNPLDVFRCGECGLNIDGWTAFKLVSGFRQEYDFILSYCPRCGRKILRR